MEDLLSRRILERRTDLGLSQIELGEKADIGQKQISRYETGVGKPSVEVLVRIARALETTTDFLLGLTNVANRNEPSPCDELSAEGIQAARLIGQIDERLRPAALYALEDTVRDLQEKPGLVLALLNRMGK